MHNKKTEDKIRIAHPYNDETIENDVISLLRSGNFAQGESVRKFELAISNYLRSKHAVAVNSGTAALLVALGSVKLSNSRTDNRPA